MVIVTYLYVYTCILNGFDNLRPPAVESDPSVRYICFTNVPNMPRIHPWEFRPAYMLGNQSPSRSARVPKFLPHLLLPPDCTYSIYHDGNFRLRLPPGELIDRYLSKHDWAVHRHPERGCIYQEADLIMNASWCSEELRTAIQAEICTYKRNQYPANNGLWANGIILRRHTEGVKDLNEYWWNLYLEGGPRDQISFPVARMARNFPVNTIESNIFSSPIAQWSWHAAWKDREDNPDFWPERDRTRARLERLKQLTGDSGGIGFMDY